jgi:protein O-GlcNAc transferase
MTASDALASALAAHRAGRPETAVPIYRALLASEPENPDLRHLLALALHGLGAQAAADAELRRTLALAPSVSLYLHNAANLAGSDESRHSGYLSRALAVQPAAAEAYHRLGAMSVRAGRYAYAAMQLRRALALDPSFPPALFDGANLFADAGNATLAITAYRRLLAIADHEGGLGACGSLLARVGRPVEAASFLARLARLAPGRADVHGVLGMALGDAGDQPGAIASLRRSLALAPAAAEIWHTLGLAFIRDPGTSEAAIEAADRSILLAPEAADPHSTRALAFFHQGRVRDAITARRTMLVLNPGDAQAHYEFLPFLHLDPELDPEEQFAFRRRIHRRFSDPLTCSAAPHANDPDPDRRLKIGYVDNRMLRQSTHSAMLLPIVEAHDPRQVAVHFYTNLPESMADDMTQRYRVLAAGFRQVDGLSDGDVADLVRADDIDILIDISSHLGGIRTGVLARKPAPIQVTLLQVGSSGLEAMDYAVTDPAFLPADRPRLFTETIIPTPVGYIFEAPADLAPPIATPPSDRPPTFGSFNLLAKCGEAVLQLWSRVLGRVPQSRLILKAAGLASPTTRQRIGAFFADRGIAPDRLDLLPWARTPADHLATYEEVDVVLDCFPYPGITTSLEAILMGVPVVTLAGDRYVSRFGEAILAAIDHPEWIARDADDYVAIAARLACDPERRMALRRSLRPTLLSSPLSDPLRFTGAMEKGFRQAWQAWCRNPGRNRHG